MNHIFLKEMFKALLRAKFVMDLLFRPLETRQGLANVVKMATKSGRESSGSYIFQRKVTRKIQNGGKFDRSKASFISKASNNSYERFE